ncbi:type IX secretion system outer membrane channel protein PorV [Capnocytophaga cynodegmi]|uniref:type IX secretion system outer membrane channel protein PorV n=1 Tax=Capnocytophaga cynodegmi TaxID=28189 RepID=UPI00385CA220
MKHFICFLFCAIVAGYSQNIIKYPDSRIITTAVPFITLNTDATSLGLGNMGVATDPDVFSQQWNAAKYIFAVTEKGLGLSYSPYLNSLVGDMYLGNISFFKKLKRQNSAWSASFTYFNAGSINLSQYDNDAYIPQGTERPYEFFVDFGYALKLSEHFSMAVTARYLRSELSIYSRNLRNTAFSFASDISGFYTSKKISHSNYYGKYNIGFQIANIGAKVKYTDFQKEFFLPTILKVGASYQLIFSNQNKFTCSIQAEKLLVPTPPQYGFDDKNHNGKQDNNEPTLIIAGRDTNVSFLNGIFQSFYDAPNGFSEEMEEIAWSVGVSYNFNNSFAVRSGYFKESSNKGSRNFFTIGSGFSVLKCGVNIAYLFSVSKEVSPLEKAIRISIEF